MYAGTHFTDLERMESWVNFSMKEGHTEFNDQAEDWTWDLRVGMQRPYLRTDARAKQEREFYLSQAQDRKSAVHSD